MPAFINIRKTFRVVFLLLACLWLSPVSARAQSIDINAPIPVRTNEVSATIVARDLGDSRLTDHFYAFTGTPGDLLITVDSRNMNGDVDVFTAAGLRPLLKFTIYAGGSEPITKSIYLRQRQDLILRVEARTPNDDEALYRIRFGGAFEPIQGGPLLAETEGNASLNATAETRSGKKGRRVSSVGARIEEPAETEVATTPPAEVAPTAEESKPNNVKPTARNSRSRRPARGSRSTTSTKEEKVAETIASGTESSAPAPVGASPSASKPAPRRRGSRRGPSKAAPEPEPNTGPRLVIETNDGTLIEHYMSSVRRVTVENGLVVIVAKDGKIQRVLLENVVRMSIAP